MKKILGRISFEYDGHQYEHGYEFPAGTPKDIMELALLGLLYENDWTQVDYEISFDEEVENV